MKWHATRLVPISSHAAALLCHAVRHSTLMMLWPAMDLMSRSRPLARSPHFSCRWWSRNVALNDQPLTAGLNTNRYGPLQQRHNWTSIHFTGSSRIFLKLGQKVIWNLVRAESTAVVAALLYKLYWWRQLVGYHQVARRRGDLLVRWPGGTCSNPGFSMLQNDQTGPRAQKATY